MEQYLLVIACVVAALVVWGLMRVGAKRPTAGWAWALVLLFALALVVDIIAISALGTNTKTTFSSVPEQKEEEK